MRISGKVVAALFTLIGISGYGTTALGTTVNGITITDQFLFVDYDSINDVGVPAGLNFKFGASISGGSANYDSGGIFTPNGSTTPTLKQTLFPCGPTSTAPDFCGQSTPVANPKLNGPWGSGLNGTWDLKIKSPGGTTATFSLPTTAGLSLTPEPFPSSVTITNSASGVNPTINWTLPSGFTPNGFAVLIFDRSAPLLANGTADVIYQTTFPSSKTSFQVPTSANLSVGNNYTIGFQTITTRSGNPAGPSSDFKDRSFAWFDFTPQIGANCSITSPSGCNISLPMVSNLNGVYQYKFDDNNVGPNFVTFIDPTIAIGYSYNTGAGDPNFASVILPDVGGGIFDLSYLSINTILDAGVQYFFPVGGVSEFTVTGIDPSADLDPADTLAFITGLTFVSDGSFTGTMTPITENVVPEPRSLGLLASSVLGLSIIRRRRHAGVKHK